MCFLQFDVLYKHRAGAAVLAKVMLGGIPFLFLLNFFIVLYICGGERCDVHPKVMLQA